jgi:3-deoxy-D-manno-octulosonic-acid transferase
MVGLFRETLSNGIVIGAQGEDDAERFRSIGANPARTHVTGNIKFDIAVPPEVGVRGRELREFHAKGRSVWVAGSTHAGEEQAVLEAHRLVRQKIPNALLILAPRHPNRFNEVADWLAREGARFVRRSQGMPCEARTEVLLVDTLGELLNFYAAADVAFVGGSLVPIGGHNLLEPAALGLPILTGPHNFNSQDVARMLMERGAAQVIHDATELSAKLITLFEEPQLRARAGALARACVEDNRGALASLLGLIAPLLKAQEPAQSHPATC